MNTTFRCCKSMHSEASRIVSQFKYANENIRNPQITKSYNSRHDVCHFRVTQQILISSTPWSWNNYVIYQTYHATSAALPLKMTLETDSQTLAALIPVRWAHPKPFSLSKSQSGSSTHPSDSATVEGRAEILGAEDGALDGVELLKVLPWQTQLFIWFMTL